MPGLDLLCQILTYTDISILQACFEIEKCNFAQGGLPCLGMPTPDLCLGPKPDDRLALVLKHAGTQSSSGS